MATCFVGRPSPHSIGLLTRDIALRIVVAIGAFDIHWSDGNEVFGWTEGDMVLDMATKLPYNVRAGGLILKMDGDIGRMIDSTVETLLAERTTSASVKVGSSERTAPLLRRAAELRPDDAAWQTQMGRALEEAGDLAGAAETYRNVLERGPENDVTRGLLAENLFRQGKEDKAIALLRTGLERRPKSGFLRIRMASLLERSGQIPKTKAEEQD